MLKYWTYRKGIVYPTWPGIVLSNLRLKHDKKIPANVWIDVKGTLSPATYIVLFIYF